MSFDFDSLPSTKLSELKTAGVVRSSSTADSDLQSLPEVLNTIKQTLEDFRNKQVAAAQTVLHSAQKQADGGVEDLAPQAIQGRFSGYQPQLSQFSIELRKADIEQADDVYKSRAKNYSDFRITHHRQYSAHHFDKPFWSWGVGGLVAVLFFIEASMNAFLFKEAAGLATAYTLAFSQSFVNIGGCFLIGKFLIGPVGAVPEMKRKISFAIPLFIHLLFTIWINLALGLYRAININFSEQVEDRPEMANAALQPWGYLELLDTPSAIVVFVGLVLAALAYLKGFLSDDPYPGYGRMARAAMEEQKKTKKGVENLNQEKNSIQKEFSEARQKVAADIKSGLKEWSDAINLMEKIAVDYRALIENLNTQWENSLASFEGGLQRRLPSDLRAPLFGQDLADPNKVFSDARQYFKTDNERLAGLDALEKKSNEDRNSVEANIKENIDGYLTIIGEITQAYPSRVKFP
jgi:hypothetical protein